METKKSKNPVEQWVSGLKILLDSYKNWSGTIADHSTIIGDSREFFIREILSRFLPNSFIIGNGQIIDMNFNLSKQVDIIIAKNDYPMLTSLSTSDIFFSESILATIEVKSRLTGGKAGTLYESLTNCHSVQSLDYNVNVSRFWDIRAQLPATCIFGLTGYKKDVSKILETNSYWIEEYEPSFFELPNIIISEEVVVLKNTHEIFSSSIFENKLGYNCVFIAKQANDAFSWLIFYLLARLLKFKESNRLSFDFFRKKVNPEEWTPLGKFNRENPERIQIL